MTATREGRCDRHAAEFERSRGTRQQRGYDAAFDQARAAAAPDVAAGLVDCWRCGERIGVGEAWDMGHADGGVLAGPEHAARCNRRAAGLKASGQEWSPAATSAPPSDELARVRADRQARAARAVQRRLERLAARGDS